MKSRLNTLTLRLVMPVGDCVPVMVTPLVQLSWSLVWMVKAVQGRVPSCEANIGVQMRHEIQVIRAILPSRARISGPPAGERVLPYQAASILPARTTPASATPQRPPSQFHHP